MAVARLDAHVDELVLERHDPAVSFLDLPKQVSTLAGDALHNGLIDVLARRSWIDDDVCREMAGRLESSGWVARVNFVRRSSDASFEVSCRYRVPVAMVQRDAEFYLVDQDAVRLPGQYLYHPESPLVQGVTAAPPGPGVTWAGQDVRAGLAVLAAIRSEPFSRQVTAVLVDNFDGRRDHRDVHLELATDRSGGRIRWGSAPGRELEENTVAQKVAILRANYARTGRVDADHPIIDISTLPDRFTIPG